MDEIYRKKKTMIAKRWKAREAMGEKFSRKEQKESDDTCITELAIKMWIEIGGTKRRDRIVEGKRYRINKVVGIGI